ncbi:Os03g0358500 [Oryza sativa Japonica Group]|uniref:Os03g0358500 protein n=1 Tax=Oryza sativa subsp. japonica TaxID=39947 RepID=A0A0P0VXK4_ORYSJ|nr:Os03g0358500 [Oryza sativa Japonica Group]
MGKMEQNLGNVTATNDMWKSHRGTVIRIEALALLAIALSFFLIALCSFRRRSNHWFVQKGVLATNVLSLSLSTYSIGLMQSSSVKSEVYPIWAVSMLTLFGCIDSITTYGHDYMGQLWKILYQLCLYSGYVLLISISAISSDVGYIAMGILSAITFIKGFHRSLALMLPSLQRDMIKMIAEVMAGEVISYSTKTDYLDQLNCPDLIGYHYVVHWPLDKSKAKFLPQSSPDDIITIDKILQCNEVHFLSDVCLSFSLSHLLQRRFYRFRCAESKHLVARKFLFEGLLMSRDAAIDYKRVFNVIEVELSFLYDIFFTRILGLQYIEQVFREMWGIKIGDSVELHDDVKAAIVDFLISSNCKLQNWPSSLNDDGWSGTSFLFLPDHVVTIMRFHIATCYCELVMHKEGFSVQDEDVEEIVKKNHGVATTLSKYCAYLMVSAPRLLHRHEIGTKSVYSQVAQAARISLYGAKDKLDAMRRLGKDDEPSEGARIFQEGVAFGKQLETMPKRWEVLANFWIKALVYAAPSDNVEEHIEHLAKGGEFITHLWALLSHAGILKWREDEYDGPATDTDSTDVGGGSFED